jgi:hypothetical protein
VAIWPFETSLERLPLAGSVVAAEIYPRAAYGTALSPALPAAPKAVAKSKAEIRRSFVQALQESAWIRRDGVVIEDYEAAIRDDGDFDALMTTAALLRLTLAGEPLSCFVLDRTAEGGMLGV